MIDLEALKSALEGLAEPGRLNDHPLTRAGFVNAYRDHHPEAQSLPAGPALGWALADFWRERFVPSALTARFKRHWNLFLTLEVGYFYPFRKQTRFPGGLAQIGAVLSDREQVALVIADGDETHVQELLQAKYADFWEALVPSDKKEALTLGLSTVASRRDTALRELLKELNKVEATLSEAQPGPQSSTSAVSALELYLRDMLPAAPTVVPDEWREIIQAARAAPRAFIQGEVGSGKTLLLSAIAHDLMQAGAVPLYVSLSEYAPYATTMDLLHFAPTHGAFAQSYRDEPSRRTFEQQLAEAQRAEQLIVLADQSDDLFEDERVQVSRRLSDFRRLILAERAPRLTLDRRSAISLSMPDLSPQSMVTLLAALGASPESAQQAIAALQPANVALNLSLAHLTTRTASETCHPHSVTVTSQWIDRLLNQARPTGTTITEADGARRLLRYLAGIRFEMAPHPEPTTNLTRDNIRRSFWHLPLRPEDEEHGWVLIDGCCRAGLLSRIEDQWQFSNAHLERALAAEYAFEEPAWVSLRPSQRELMKWAAALIAHRGDGQRQQVFFGQLRSALNGATLLSVLDVADFLTEFHQRESTASQAFKAEIIQRLKRLMQSPSSQVRVAATQKARSLGSEAGSVGLDVSAYMFFQPEPLDTEAHDLAGLLRQLSLTSPPGDQARWLEDRRVINGLLDGLCHAPSVDLKRRCAAWLRRSSLSKVVEVHVPANAWWKTRSQSALEVVAQVAQNSAQDELTRTLAKSVLAKDEFLIRLWQLGDKYTPLVYDLLLTLDKRLFLTHASLSAQEWKISQ